MNSLWWGANWSSLQFAGCFGVYLLLRWMLFCGFFTYLAFRYPHRKVDSSGLRPGQIGNEMMANFTSGVIEIVFWTSAFSLGLFQVREFNLGALAFSFVFTYVFFEVWFFGTHWLYHHPTFWWIHRQHHRSQVTTPLTAWSLSPAEKALNIVGMLIIPGLFSHLLPIIFEGVFIYHLYNNFINVAGHSNLEFLPKRLRFSRLGQVFTTTTSHAFHHRRGRGNLGLFTTLFDRWVGTELSER